VPVPRFLGALQAELKGTAGVIVGVGVEGHEARHAAEFGHGGEQLGAQFVWTVSMQQLCRPAELGVYGLTRQAATVGVVPGHEGRRR
jgi:hypothetical protein